MLDALLKADKYLATDTRAMGRARGILHGKDRYAGTSRASFDELKKTATDNYRESIPDVRQAVSDLGGDWQVAGAIETYDKILRGFYQEYEKQGISTAEAKYRAHRRTIAKLDSLSNDKESSFVEITSPSNNATIRVYATDKDSQGRFGSSLDGADAKSIRDAIFQARKYKFNSDPLTINVLDNDSKVGPKAVHDELGDGDVAFTYIGGDGIYLYPKKVENVTKSDTWFSTSTNTRDETIKHLVVHESGHLQMYKLWGEDSSGRGSRQALEKDFAKFNVQKNGTSDYGDESISESFAEQYAKYLRTGDASPEFMELLSSKGLTRAQINKKWREQHSSLLGDRFFTLLDAVFAEEDQGVVPEYNGPEANEYSRYGKYGAGRVHKIARIFGFAGNKPRTVSSIKDDEKVIWRGVKPNAEMSETQMHEHTRTADMPYYTYGVYGDGNYSSKSRSEADGYSGTRRSAIKMRVADDAKIYIDRSMSEFGFDKATMNGGVDLRVIHSQLFRSGGILQQVVLNEIDPDTDTDDIWGAVDQLKKKLALSGSYDDDRTILAAIMGFQGVEVSGNWGDSYAIFLDRSMIEMVDMSGGQP